MAENFLSEFRRSGVIVKQKTSAPSGPMALTISQGTRADFAPSADMYNISMDFNSFEGGRGTEVIIPDNASPQVRQAAERFNQLVVDFAAKHGYSGYKNRGVKTTSENKRGVRNTIHAEPFFTQDSQMEKIINENIAEFSQLYTQAFGSLNARLVAPHGVTKNGVQDRGAVSPTFKDELTFGNMILSNLSNTPQPSSQNDEIFNLSLSAVRNIADPMAARQKLKQSWDGFNYLTDQELDGIVQELQAYKGEQRSSVQGSAQPTVNNIQEVSYRGDGSTDINPNSLRMIGGVNNNDVYQTLGAGGGGAHDASYRDYSQLFREYTTQKKAGYVEVGSFSGMPVYAAPDYAKDSSGNYIKVNKNDAVRMAAELGGIIPTREMVNNVYQKAARVNMATQPIYKTGGEGDSAQYTQEINRRLQEKNIQAGQLVVHGKEFYAEQ